MFQLGVAVSARTEMPNEVGSYTLTRAGVHLSRRQGLVSFSAGT